MNIYDLFVISGHGFNMSFPFQVRRAFGRVRWSVSDLARYSRQRLRSNIGNCWIWWHTARSADEPSVSRTPGSLWRWGWHMAESLVALKISHDTRKSCIRRLKNSMSNIDYGLDLCTIYVIGNNTIKVVIQGTTSDFLFLKNAAN